MCSAGRRGGRRLVMAFLAVRTADVLDRNAVHGTGLQVLVEALVNVIELVAIVARAVGEIDLGRTVTADTPSHAEGCELFDLVHLLDRSVTGLALHLAGLGMLCMAEENVVGQIVYFDPLYRLGLGGIVFAALGVITGVAIELLDLGRAVHF